MEPDTTQDRSLGMAVYRRFKQSGELSDGSSALLAEAIENLDRRMPAWETLKGELALKKDLLELRAEFKQDMAGLRAEFKQDMAGLRTELKGEVAHLRTLVSDKAAEAYRLNLILLGGGGGLLILGKFLEIFLR